MVKPAPSQVASEVTRTLLVFLHVLETLFPQHYYLNNLLQSHFNNWTTNETPVLWSLSKSAL